ncbi:unnamed protein product [Ostreobium quekettii]|uniref:Uncharacterized protein n=1 Tax=Ostreobium quekettii TaxID=121088 RepID=A0A8S1JD26_9CHLO|nr:unnamed protein product [Ostreobium quekettii]
MVGFRDVAASLFSPFLEGGRGMRGWVGAAGGWRRVAAVACPGQASSGMAVGWPCWRRVARRACEIEKFILEVFHALWRCSTVQAWGQQVRAGVLAWGGGWWGHRASAALL